MEAEVWQRVSSLLDELLDLPPSEQQTRLARLRDSEPTIARELATLLQEQSIVGPLKAPPESLRTDWPSDAPRFDYGRAGRFVILEEIARGGMGAIYRAEDAAIGRTLAVKVLLPEARTLPDAEAWFEGEARITGRLQHPGVPPVHELGRLSDGSPFFVMKLIVGRTLSEAIRDADWPARAVGVFEQIASTLAYAHSQQVIHRDLKPGNVMVGAFGEVQVMDWGLARDLTAGDSPDFDGVVGTPAYMAPEQARGERDLDPRCDVFGLGALLAAMLTGKPLYSGDSAAELLQRARDADVALALAAIADPELRAIAARCLAPRRADRFSHAGDLADAITAYRQNLAQRLRQAELGRAEAAVRVAEERRRRRVWLSLAATLAILVIGALAVWGWNERLQAEQAARAASLNGQILATLTEADKERSSLHAVLADPLAVNVMLNDLRPWKTRLQTLAALHDRGAQLAASAPEVLAPEMEQRVEGLAADLASDRLDFEFAERADALLADLFDDTKQEKLLLVPEYKRLFALRQWNLFDDDLEDLTLRIGRSPLRLIVQATLDDLASQVMQANPKPESVTMRRILALGRALDRDPWRTRLRQPDAFYDAAQITQLTEDVDPRTQTPQTLRFVAKLRQFHNLDPKPLLNRSLQAYPADFWLLYYYGEATLTDDPAESLAAYRAALALRPRSIAVLNMFGGACLRRLDFSTAEDCFQKALEIDPSFKTAQLNLAKTLCERSNDRRHIDALDALLNAGADAGSYTFLGRRYGCIGEDLQALRCFEKAVEIDAEHKKARLNQVALSAVLAARDQLSRVESEEPRPWKEVESGLSGVLDKDSPWDCFLDQPNRYRQGFRVLLQREVIYQITIQSEFDPLLRVESDQFGLIDNNNDVREAGNPRNRLTFSVPTDGVYRLVATSYQPRATGAFQLTGRVISTPPKPRNFTGTLQRGGKLVSGRVYATYSVKLSAGETLLLKLHTPFFDSRMQLYDVRSGQMLMESTQLHPFDFRWTRLEYSALRDGSLNVLVTSEAADKIGPYTLTLVTVPAEQPAPATKALPQPVSAGSSSD